MNLCIDIGNSRIKTGLFQGKTLVDRWIYPTNHAGDLLQLLDQHPVQSIIISSVANQTVDLTTHLRKNNPVLELGSTTPLPFENLYSTPLTLGKDRLAAVAGAQALYPNENCLVVDFGTCIKYEVLSREGKYLGGNIAPGARMRIQAMHHFTARLPEVDMQIPESAIGISTETALQNGAILGTKLEVVGFIQLIQAQMSPLKVIFSGGDATFFHQMDVFHETILEPDLTLHGLNQILQFNQSQHS